MATVFNVASETLKTSPAIPAAFQSSCPALVNITNAVPSSCPALLALKKSERCSNLVTYVAQAKAVWGQKIYCNITFLQLSVIAAAKTEWSNNFCSNNPLVFSVLLCSYNAFHAGVASSCNAPVQLGLSTAPLPLGLHFKVSFKMKVPGVSIDILSLNSVIASLQQTFASLLSTLPSQVTITVTSTRRRFLPSLLDPTVGPTLGITINTASQAQQIGSYETLKALTYSSSSPGSWTPLQQALGIALLASNNLTAVQIQSSVDASSVQSVTQSGCQDLASWVDIRGTSCSTYDSMNYCLSTGDYGNGWLGYGGPFKFSQLARQGLAATQACCACGGGSTVDPTGQQSPTVATIPAGSGESTATGIQLGKMFAGASVLLTVCFTAFLY